MTARKTTIKEPDGAKAGADETIEELILMLGPLEEWVEYTLGNEGCRDCSGRWAAARLMLGQLREKANDLQPTVYKAAFAG